jgi:stearoyl-CoA desaturase (delta-9 desaturase)
MPTALTSTPAAGDPKTVESQIWTEPAGVRSTTERAQLAVTILIVCLPVVALALVTTSLLGASASLVDVGLLAGFYVITGLGITVGYHRLFTHRSFVARPLLRISLAVAGGLAFEGGAISWVATHRRHHAFTDRPGDPHSPHRYGRGVWAQLRGLAHAHLGWLFERDSTSVAKYAPDLQADRTMRVLDRMFPVFCVLSLGVPTLLGWLLTGTAHGAISGLLWGGLLRVFLLHHVTWSVNSLCHLMGNRPFKTRGQDRATNLWPLALLSFGDSWHNCHHADPTIARVGVDRGQIDIGAGFIRLCERIGLATKVRWPDASRIAGHRRAVATPPSMP